jgi:hypothetical protein
VGEPRVNDEKDPGQEDLLARVNELLAPLQERLDGDEVASVDEVPLLFLVGHQRCGSTLLGQTLVQGLHVAYPTNLIARFWRAPRVGLLLQETLYGLDPAPDGGFRSHVGTTEGPLGPHEFSYFWNHWFPQHHRCRDEDALARVLAGWSQACGLPLLFKNNWNGLRIALLARLFPGARFVHARRDLRDVALSSLRIREHRFGSASAWFGLDPAGWEALTEEPPARQVAEQLHLSEEALAAGLAGLDPGRWIGVAYEELCRDPAGVVAAVAGLGVSLRPEAELPQAFEPARPREGADAAEWEGLEAALAARFSAAEIARGTRLP